MQSEILGMVLTKEDQKWMLEQLEDLKVSMYKTDEGEWDKLLDTRLKHDVAVIIKNDLQRAVIDKKSYLRELINQVSSMKTCRITLGINPSQQLIIKISNWIKSNLDAGIVGEIKVDKSILGGVKIDYDGKYTDLSLKKAWGEAWKEQGNG